MSREHYELRLDQPDPIVYCANTDSRKEKARRMSDGAEVDLHLRRTGEGAQRYEECRCPDRT